MQLSKLLEKKRPVILNKWLGEIFDTYPADTSRFLKGEQDMFANPVGHTIRANAEFILEGLIVGDDHRALSPYLEQIIRIRAVQDFSPLQAVSFMHGLKPVIIGQLETEMHKYNRSAEWGELQIRIDRLAQRAYELHAEMKQRIANIHTKEINKSEGFFKRISENHTKW